MKRLQSFRHIAARNGLRYLGYAFTCALMQAELVVLIAPYVPCQALDGRALHLVMLSA